MPKTDAEREQERPVKLFFGWLTGVVAAVSLVALYDFGYPLHQALAYTLFILFIVPVSLVALILVCLTPYEAAFYAFMLVLLGLRHILLWLRRKRFYPRQVRAVRKCLRCTYWVLTELKGPYITAIVLWGIYFGIRNLLKPPDNSVAD